ncbi:hypothetical protein BsWGS_27920 [Bradybaena similaris]
MTKQYWLLALLCTCLTFAETWSLDASFSSPNVATVDKTTLLKRGINVAALDDIFTGLSREEREAVRRQIRQEAAGRGTTSLVFASDKTLIIID